MMGDESKNDGCELLSVKYKLLFDNARDMILFVDVNGRILDANHSAIETYGYTHEELTRMRVFDLRLSDPGELVLSQMRAAAQGGIVFETTHRTKDGRLIPVEVSSSGTRFDGQPVLVSIIRDISAKKDALEKIHRLAYYDDLTGIPNRKSFRDALTARIASRPEKFALFLIDLDHFKSVNDRFSHSVGDSFLVEIAHAMEKSLPECGSLYRLGGDEFTVILDDTCRGDACSAAALLNEHCHGTFDIDGNSIDASLSVGGSLYPEHDETESGLLKKADIALYRVKEAGRNGFALYA